MKILSKIVLATMAAIYTNVFGPQTLITGAAIPICTNSHQVTAEHMN